MTDDSWFDTACKKKNKIIVTRLRVVGPTIHGDGGLDGEKISETPNEKLSVRVVVVSLDNTTSAAIGSNTYVTTTDRFLKVPVCRNN